MLVMGFAGVEHTLASHVGVEPADYPKFRARLKQLQRLGFPDGVNIGRGAKMEYDERHLLQLAVALEVMNCGIAAKLATDIVGRLWDRFAAGLWIANNVLMGSGSSAPAVVAFLRVYAISDSSGGRAVVTIEDSNSLRNTMFRVHSDDPAANLFIDLTLLLARLMDRASSVGRLKSWVLTQSINGWMSKLPTFDPFEDGSNWLRFGEFDSDGVIVWKSDDDDPQA